jgi:hypothetical protein
VLLGGRVEDLVAELGGHPHILSKDR